MLRVLGFRVLGFWGGSELRVHYDAVLDEGMLNLVTDTIMFICNPSRLINP